MIEFTDWGLIDYQQALKKQEALVEKVFNEKLQGIVVFCSHPAVVTLGRKTQEGDLDGWQGPIIEVSRGGRATYHGPSQLVVYPIINLDHPENKFPKKDIGWFLRSLESAIVQSLKKYDIAAVGKTAQKKSDNETETEETGVWVGRQKIVSLGISIRKWTTYHGAAINVEEDPSAFQGLKPCGFEPSVMTNIEKLTGEKIDRLKYKQELTEFIRDQFLQN